LKGTKSPYEILAGLVLFIFIFDQEYKYKTRNWVKLRLDTRLDSVRADREVLHEMAESSIILISRVLSHAQIVVGAGNIDMIPSQNSESDSKDFFES
jgi:hypothetical protein